MRKSILLFAFAAAASAQQAAAPEAEARPPLAVIEIGTQHRHVSGEKTFGFQQNRDVPRNGSLRGFDFNLLREGRPFRFTLRSTDLSQRDELVTAIVEDVGRYKIRFDLTGFTRYWSNNTTALFTNSGSLFTVSDALRSTLQNSPESALGASASGSHFEIRSFRQRGILTQTYNLRRDLTLRLNYMYERRTGNRMMSQGSYVRLGGSTGDRFETPGQEIFEPTRFGTNEFGVELNYRRRNWAAGVEYRGSIFNNSYASVVWQNPFQLTGVQANPPDGATNRGRFAATQAALPPDNQAHTISANAMVLLPHSSKISGLLSWSRWTQNELFLPYTINTAIVATGLPEGTAPTSANSLPRPRLDGRINTLTQDYVATTRPVRPVQLTFRYSDYDLSNLTEEMHFPGYSAYGDSYWRTAISGQPGTAAVPIQSEAASFRRKRAQVEGALRPFRDFTWKLGYRWEGWHREHREVERSTEQGLLTSLSYAPNKSVFTQLEFRYFDRTPEAYYPGTLEPGFLRMFDQAQRMRKQGSALISVNLTPAVSLSTSWFYVGDSFDKTFFGLHQQKASSFSTDLTYNVRENFGLFAGWGYDRSGYDYLSVAKTSFPYSFANSWTRDTRDRLHSAHFGLSGSYGKGKGTYELNYGVSLARTAIDTANPNLIVANQALNAQAYTFPNVKNQFQELRLDSSYAISKNVRLGVMYRFEPYRISDFANDVISSYNPGAIAPENDARRYFFLDSGPGNYTGNLAAVYLRYSFF